MPIFPCRNWNALNFSHCVLPGIFLRRWPDSAHHISPQPTTCARRTGGQAVRGCLGGRPGRKNSPSSGLFCFCGGRGGSPARRAAMGRGGGGPPPPAPPRAPRGPPGGGGPLAAGGGRRPARRPPASAEKGETGSHLPAYGDGAAAVPGVVHGVGDDTHTEGAPCAHAVVAAACVRVFRQNKGHAHHMYVAAA